MRAVAVAAAVVVARGGRRVVAKVVLGHHAGATRVE